MINELIEDISREQSRGQEFFRKGLFPSYRVNSIWHYIRPDNNIFASLSVAFVLKGLLPLLEDTQKVKIQGIIEEVIRCLPNYQNKTGRNTCNFWSTGQHDHFPNGKFMHKWKHFKLPDDIDDTALSFLIKGFTPQEISELKSIMVQHAHEDKVYDTWFGVNMPKEKDACALCNAMLLMLASQPERNIHDKATLHFLNSSILADKHIHDPFWLSRHYGTTPLIVYHYARLIESCNPPELYRAADRLREQVPAMLQNEAVELNKILLQTAAKRLGLDLPEVPINSPINWSPAFYSFLGAPFAPLRNRLFSRIAPKKWAIISWKCTAHEKALYLENLVLNRLSLPLKQKEKS